MKTVTPNLLTKFFSCIVWLLFHAKVLICVALACDIASSSDRTKTNSANVKFLPGDAFFHTYLTEDLLALVADDSQDIEVAYDMPEMAGGLGLSAGYSRLRILDANNQVRDAIFRTYEHFRKDHPKKLMELNRGEKNRSLVEVNGFNMFIMSKDCDLSLQRIGIKYSTSWKDLHFLFSSGAEVKRTLAPSYTTFVRSPEGIVEDWEKSGEYPVLRVNAPADSGDPFLFGGKNHSIPTILMADVVIVILSESNIDPYFQQIPGVQWAEIKNDGLVLVKEFSSSNETSKKVNIVEELD